METGEVNDHAAAYTPEAHDDESGHCEPLSVCAEPVGSVEAKGFEDEVEVLIEEAVVVVEDGDPECDESDACNDGGDEVGGAEEGDALGFDVHEKCDKQSGDLRDGDGDDGVVGGDPEGLGESLSYLKTWTKLSKPTNSAPESGAMADHLVNARMSDMTMGPRTSRRKPMSKVK